MRVLVRKNKRSNNGTTRKLLTAGTLTAGLALPGAIHADPPKKKQQCVSKDRLEAQGYYEMKRTIHAKRTAPLRVFEEVPGTLNLGTLRLWRAGKQASGQLHLDILGDIQGIFGSDNIPLSMGSGLNAWEIFGIKRQLGVIPGTLGIPSTLPNPCSGKATVLKKGQEFSVGITWRVMSKLKITHVGRKTVTVDLTLPTGIAQPSVSVTSVSLTFTGVKINRKQFESSFGNLLCSSVKGTVTPVRASKHKGQIRNQQTRNAEQLLRGTQTIEGMVAGVLSLTGTPKLQFKSPPAPFKVVKRTKRYLMLQVTEGPYIGKRVRLSRNLSLHNEFLHGQARFISSPLRIKNVSTDSRGVKFDLVVDCSRLVTSDLFMSETTTPSLACKTK